MTSQTLIAAEVVNRILFGEGEGQRYTQDTPILPEVWQLLAKDPDEWQDLLITPRESCSAVGLLRELLQKIQSVEKAQPAPLQSFVAIKLDFQHITGTLLPMTQWASEVAKLFEGESASGPRQLDGVAAFRQVCSNGGAPSEPPKTEATPAAQPHPPLRGALFDAARIFALIASIAYARELQLERGAAPRKRAAANEPFIGTVEQLCRHEEEIGRRIEQYAASFLLFRQMPMIWRVASNRRIGSASEYSRATVKADAAYRVFDVRCETITWAVIDSGIDSTHPAFRRRKPAPGQTESRIVRTYNLGILRGLLNAAYMNDPAGNPVLQTAIRDSKLEPATAVEHLRNAYRAYLKGTTQILDWSSIEPLLRMKEPDPPLDGHGTHVAGILGADWRHDDGSPRLTGLCPDIQLMDMRILGSAGGDSEFAVIGALQLVRYLNSHNQHIEVHGVNLSLSIPHMVENYACGRTPVCDECERLVSAGVTVVAAAGNHGYKRFRTDKGEFSTYSMLSITDPGNAASVITVGSTHRREPHTYGISYFSSRGPTGDGRMKPDLVAPGERIKSTLPGKESGALDGTSQATPHVSAAAAMLMARYPELNRDPQRIKQILCGSATDLGRERAFQGHGLLDILRALQSF